MSKNIEELLEKAIEVAKAGGDHTRQYFNANVRVERKGDDSPVTQADRETEQLMRQMVEEEFPEHGIIGEEFGQKNSDSEVQWIFDPIDGTRSFIHGVPLYTTLVGIVIDSEPVIGVIYAPIPEELCDGAKGLGSRLNGTRCNVRDCETLANATFLSTDVTHAKERNLDSAQQALLNQTKLHRTWGDAYGHMLVATGRADIMFDAELNIWDAAPLLPIVQEAGGIFSDTNGNQIIDGPNGFSCNKTLYPKIMNVLSNA